MRQLSALQSLLFALFIALSCPGCGGSSDRPKLGGVTGTVSYKGEPLANGDIAFYPEKGRSASGQISNGKIVNVETFDKNDGAPVGNLKVTVTAFDGPKDDMYKPAKRITPEKYSSVASTDLTAEIKAGSNDLKLELKD